MMVADTTPEPLTLGEILSAVARRASDGQLLVMTFTGLGGAVAIEQLLGRAGWLGAAGALAVGAYGVWGIADRELNDRLARSDVSRTASIALRAARGLGAAVAALATLALFASVFIPLLGLWRS